MCHISFSPILLLPEHCGSVCGHNFLLLGILFFFSAFFTATQTQRKPTVKIRFLLFIERKLKFSKEREGLVLCLLETF